MTFNFNLLYRVISGNECFLKMQMPLAGGEGGGGGQIKVLASTSFLFHYLVIVASPLQGMLTGTDKPLYGPN